MGELPGEPLTGGGADDLDDIVADAVAEEIASDVLRELSLDRGGRPGPGILGPVCGSTSPLIRVGVSARHVHLCRKDLDSLFGDGYPLTIARELSQPGQFAAAEVVTLVGPRGTISGVRILGPVRHESQVEVSATDAVGLGLSPPVRESGHVGDSASVLVVGPRGSVTLEKGVILAARHLHLHTQDSRQLGIANGSRVALRCGGARAVIFLDVVARVSNDYRLEFHVDTDEANAGGLVTGDWVELVSV